METSADSEILSPDVPVATAAAGKITVRELNWKASKAFLAQLATRTAAFITVGPDGKVNVNTGRLLGALFTDLGETLLLACCEGLTPERLDALPLADVAALLDQAVALNLRPEMIEQGKAVAERIRSLVGARPAEAMGSAASIST